MAFDMQVLLRYKALINLQGIILPANDMAGRLAELS
jgi:hypothetical protein